MKITKSKNHDGKMIVKVAGRLDTSETTRDFSTVLMKLIDEGERQIVLDLNSIKIINSVGMGKILASHKRLEACGGELYLQAPLEGIIKDMSKIFRLDALLKQYSIQP